ncbi:hypothetical protein [Chryseobacterium fistulae]|uniref:Uncharacterized protein n=1 Tax=Chryseobacterium fistulae TaxID=2675058 RepID=A0A6N4XQE3_9FLAO|nr:hypothetical protein [Chryseobacterium fistulae]CAA7390069.1 hypothetical protein CHRY9393_02367 [Chryseobacterium fistulae]
MKNLFNALIIMGFFYFTYGGFNDFTLGSPIKSSLSALDKGEIIYLFFQVEKNNSGQYKIALQDKKITEGKLKSIPSFNEKSVKVGDLIISLMDSNNKDLVKQILEDPLNPIMENYSEEGISRNLVPLQKAEFSIRYPKLKSITMIKIEKKTLSGTQIIFTEKL